MSTKQKTSTRKPPSSNNVKRTTKRRAPETIDDLPRCPAELDDRAKSEWQYITKWLKAQGQITKLDRAVIAEYCAAYSLWIKALKLSKGEDLTFKTEKGYEQQSPIIGIVNKTATRMLRAAAKLGLTPADREEIQDARREKPSKKNILD